MGALAYRRFQDPDFDEDADRIRERISANVQQLEERMQSILDAATGELSEA